MSDYEKLSGRELDAAVAEKVMGREILRAGSQPHGGPPESLYLPLPGKIVERFSTDDNAARLVRDRIAELNLRNKFVEALYPLVQEPGSDFNILQSTPRQQCIAALMALEVKV